MKVPYFQPYAYGGEIVLSGSFFAVGKAVFYMLSVIFCIGGLTGRCIWYYICFLWLTVFVLH